MCQQLQDKCEDTLAFLQQQDEETESAGEWTESESSEEDDHPHYEAQMSENPE